MDYSVFLKFIFPDGMFDYFEFKDFKEKQDKVEVYFEEKNIVPKEYFQDKLESKGFYQEIKMYDYPMRGKSCILYIKKRRWYNHTQNAYVSRDWNLVASGTQISKEFASFLKAMHRLSSN